MSYEDSENEDGMEECEFWKYFDSLFCLYDELVFQMLGHLTAIADNVHSLPKESLQNIAIKGLSVSDVLMVKIADHMLENCENPDSADRIRKMRDETLKRLMPEEL